MAQVAPAHGVNANQAFTWRRLYRQGDRGAGNHAVLGLLVVRVADPEAGPKATEAHRTISGPTAERIGTIQIESPKERLRITGPVDRDTLRVALEALLG